jgi:predicted tellurium resistance membrane protein TerC
MLALAFLVLIGTNLVAEGFGHHIRRATRISPMFLLVLRGDAEPEAPRQAGGG